MSVETRIVYDRSLQLARAQRAQARRVALSSARNIGRRAGRLAPVSRPPDVPEYYHGNLAASLFFENHPHHILRREREGEMMTVGTNTFYAVYQEFGTVRNPAQPFLYPAVTMERPNFEARMRRIYSESGARAALAGIRVSDE